MKNENKKTALRQPYVKRDYWEWEREIVKMINQYPLLHNKWRGSVFREMFNDGMSVQEAFRCWICGHS